MTNCNNYLNCDKDCMKIKTVKAGRLHYFYSGIILIAVLVAMKKIWKISYKSSDSFNLLLNGPPNFNLTLSPEDYRTLINLNNFDFVINQNPCNEKTGFLLLILVHSAPKNWEQRQLIRQSWGSWSKNLPEGIKVRILFLLGEVSSKSLQICIQKENRETQDILQGRFMDSYSNITYKHVMGLKWFTYHCPGASYLLKADDDVFVNIPNLINYLIDPDNLSEPRPKVNKFILCKRDDDSPVPRSYRSKWRISPSVVPWHSYPRICHGASMLYSSDVVPRLYQRTRMSLYFPFDDVYVSLFLASQLNLTITDVADLYLPYKNVSALIDCFWGSKYLGQHTSILKEDTEIESCIKIMDRIIFGYEYNATTILQLWKISRLLELTRNT